jgi:hypothetical protein
LDDNRWVFARKVGDAFPKKDAPQLRDMSLLALTSIRDHLVSLPECKDVYVLMKKSQANEEVPLAFSLLMAVTEQIELRVPKLAKDMQASTQKLIDWLKDKRVLRIAGPQHPVPETPETEEERHKAGEKWELLINNHLRNLARSVYSYAGVALDRT